MRSVRPDNTQPQVSPGGQKRSRQYSGQEFHSRDCTGGWMMDVEPQSVLMDRSTALTYIKGVGPGRAAMFEAKGLRTVEDLLSYFPFRYEDRSNMKPISQLAPGEMATVIAEVRTAKLAGFRRKNLGLFEASFTDPSRAILMGKWFHGQYLAGVLAPGQKVALFGKVEYDTYSGALGMLHPEIEI